MALHSLLRWLILVGLLLSLIRAYHGWIKDQLVLKFDRHLIAITVILLYLQLVLGMFLYFRSPLVDYFLHHFNEAVHNTDLRFFGMEHVTAMSIAIILISIGFFKGRKKSGREWFETIAFWFTLGFLLICFSIPWAFSPFTGRPYFRGF